MREKVIEYKKEKRWEISAKFTLIVKKVLISKEEKHGQESGYRNP